MNHHAKATTRQLQEQEGLKLNKFYTEEIGHMIKQIGSHEDNFKIRHV